MVEKAVVCGSAIWLTSALFFIPLFSGQFRTTIPTVCLYSAHVVFGTVCTMEYASACLSTVATQYALSYFALYGISTEDIRAPPTSGI